MHGFSDKIAKVAEDNRSPLVLALDPSVRFAGNIHRKTEIQANLLIKSLDLIEETSDLLAAVKINRHLILPLGLYGGILEILDRVKEAGLPSIVDAKINDIGNTNRWIAIHYMDAGFDAVIANPFVGWKGGLDAVFEEANERNKGVILLVYMSHPAAPEGYGRMTLDEQGKRLFYLVFAEKALEWGASGVVVGATQLAILEVIYDTLGGKIPIFAPGVGAQGGDPRLAQEAGAKYLIVGRTIFESAKPRETIKKILTALK
ncbi:MAG: orotidine 5'-phosphate decarboxylase / HUMPS family protein [Candidatus Heimdallarchaeota archaeon]